MDSSNDYILASAMQQMLDLQNDRKQAELAAGVLLSLAAIHIAKKHDSTNKTDKPDGLE